MSEPVVTTEVAVVFRAGRRRYLSKRGAYQALAKAMIRARCGCEDGDDVTSGYTCRYHRLDHYPTLVKRLTRWLARPRTARTTAGLCGAISVLPPAEERQHG